MPLDTPQPSLTTAISFHCNNVLTTPHVITLINSYTTDNILPINSISLTSNPNTTNHLDTIVYPISNKAAIAIADLTTHKPSGILSPVSSYEPPPPPPENPNNIYINPPFNYTSSTDCIIAACPPSTAHVLTTEVIQQSHYDTYHPNILKMLAERTKISVSN